jgi:hypothetical protein
MTEETMAERILEIIRQRGGATFVELIDELGSEARGDGVLPLPKAPNIILWAGVSDKFTAALNLVKDRLVPEPCNQLVYLFDGDVLDLPPFEYKYVGTDTECWVPVQLVLRKEG